MKFHPILILALFSMQLSAQNMQEIERKLSVAELNEDFKLLKTELEEKHPGLYLYTKKPTLDSIFLAIQNSLNVEMTSIDFYRKVNKLRDMESITVRFDLLKLIYSSLFFSASHARIPSKNALPKSILTVLKLDTY